MFAARTRWNRSTNPLAASLEERKRVGLPILDLTESNPTHCGFSQEADDVLSALAGPESLVYEPEPRGLASARRAVVDYYSDHGVPISPQQIVLTTGTSEAYSFVFRLLADPGDEILSPAPSYPLFDFLADVNDVKAVRYPLLCDDGWHIDLHRLAALVTPRTRAVIIVSPNNPTGSFLSRAELDGLIDLAVRHDLAILADEVFCDYAWGADPERAESLAAIDSCLTFTLNGLSKICALPQMKLGWMVVNGPHQPREEALSRLEIITDTYLSVSTPIQLAAGALLDQRKRIQPQILDRIQTNLELLDQALQGDSPCSRLRAQGGWYAVLRMPAARSDEEWALELLREEGVYVHPGHFFAFPSGSYLVVSLITREPEFANGIERILARAKNGT